VSTTERDKQVLAATNSFARGAQKSTPSALIDSAKHLRAAVARLRFAPPVAYVYNPLEYAWAAHEMYLRRYGNGRKRVIFLGMNPGPFGMVQTGIPFGQVSAVRDWLRIEAPISGPAKQHPKRLVTGFACQRGEISGERLWGLFAQRFDTADIFFNEHFVVNYCPLAFVEASSRNRTPEKLRQTERETLFAACDEHLREAVTALAPEWLIGIGDFAANRARQVFANADLQLGRILHPSPACPASNVDWAGKATAQLEALGVW
jgi:single-strand selective monofunctional uracil DNA glycosylase